MRVSSVLLAAAVVCSGVTFAAEKGQEDELAKVQRLLVDLADGTTRERANAARELGGLSPEAVESQGVVDALGRALADDVPFVKLAVIGAFQSMYSTLGKPSQKSAKDALSKVIDDSEENAAVRAAAILALIGKVNEDAYDDKGVFRKVDKIVADEKESPLVSSAAIDFEIAYDRPLPVDNILKGLKSKDPDVQRRALQNVKNIVARSRGGVSPIPPRKAVELLEMAQEKGRPSDVRAGLIALVAIIHKRGTSVRGVPDVFEKIAKRKDEDVTVRVAAVIALGRTGDPGSAKAVLRVFDEQKGVDGKEGGALRAACCEAAGEFFPMLAKRGDFGRYKMDAGKLITMLIHTIDNDEDTPAVIAAVLAAGNLNPKVYDCRDMIDALIEALKDTNKTVTDAALEVLRLITGESWGDYEGWRGWYDNPRVKQRFSGRK